MAQQPTHDFVRFNLHPRHNQRKSREAGRPIYEDVEYIEIIVPGDKDNIVHRPVREDDKQTYALQYQAWKAGREAPQEGTPLAEWPGITRAQVEELAYFRVRTVEQLAAMSDGNGQTIPGIISLKARAKDFLEKAKGNAPLEEMRAELSQRDNLIQLQSQRLAQQEERLAQMQEAIEGLKTQKKPPTTKQPHAGG